jgi:hypothetical protein
MSVPTIPVSEPATQPESLDESEAVERRPLSDLLPTGGLRVFVVAVSLA